MNKILIILPFLLPTIIIKGQTPSFFTDGSRWVHHTHESWEPGQQLLHNTEEQNIIHGDTVIAGVTYQKLYTTYHYILVINLEYPHPHTIYQHSYDSIGPSFVRHDTLANRVFFLPAVDSTERLIYDFTLEVGDTTPMQAEIFSTSIIGKIDTVSLFGGSLKRFFVIDAIYGMIDQQNYILEGIGGSNGLTFFRPEIPTLGGGVFLTNLICFQYQDNTYAPWDGECPFIDFINATHDAREGFTLTVGPNPTRSELAITISDELFNSTFMLVDILGRVIQSKKLHDVLTTVYLTSPGIYFWHVMKDGHSFRTGKVVCE